MSSEREQVIAGVVALVKSALPNADVERNLDKPKSISPGGLVVVRDGDPGDPEIDLSPLSYNYEHRIPLEVTAYASASKTREQVLDDMLTALGFAVLMNRFLGGLVDFLDMEAPTSEDLQITGSAPARWADAAIVASYATSSPLN